MTVGETPCVTVDDAALYTGFDRNELQMVFQFEHMDVDASEGGVTGKWSDRRFNLVDLKKVLTHWQEGLHGRGWNSAVLEQPRPAAHRLPLRQRLPRVPRPSAAKMLRHRAAPDAGHPLHLPGRRAGHDQRLLRRRSEDYNDLEIHDSWRKYVEESRPRLPLRTCCATSAPPAAITPVPPCSGTPSENAGFHAPAPRG